MRSLITTTALLILIGSPVAIAQTGTGGGSSTATKNTPMREAPVGHRQPRASDVPPERTQDDPNDLLSKENAILDRKIKGICRGC